MALDNGAKSIITAAFSNLTTVCDYLISQNQNVIPLHVLEGGQA
jgi:hypothetical protein